MVDFIICLNESLRIGQFAKNSRSFVRLFVHISGSGESWSLSQSDSAPPSFSFKQITNAQFSAELVRLSPSLVLILKRIMIVQWCKWSSINTKVVVGGARSRVSGEQTIRTSWESGQFVYVKESFVQTDSWEKKLWNSFVTKMESYAA